LSSRPVALYYRMLQFQPSNRMLLSRLFEVRELDSPADDEDVVLADVEFLFAPLGFRVDDAKLGRCPRLRAILSNTTGIPHIDANAAKARGIAVVALHDDKAFLENITPTAEHAIGLMLAATRRLIPAHRAATAGDWDRRPWGAPRMLSRMRLGLVGYGRLGRKVGVAAKALGMEVAYYDPRIPGGYGDLSELAQRSDVLSLHAPANAETDNLVSRKILQALPKGAIVVNTARGELLDEDALLDLLESGHLYAAALDTVRGEYDAGFSERFAQSRLATYARTHDNLVLTPHIGGSTVDAWTETERRVIERAVALFDLPEAS
jgi:D-3-phosphoglycerate dehydrogenase